jgi:hypothetical protein
VRTDEDIEHRGKVDPPPGQPRHLLTFGQIDSGVVPRRTVHRHFDEMMRRQSSLRAARGDAIRELSDADRLHVRDLSRRQLAAQPKKHDLARPPGGDGQTADLSEQVHSVNGLR